LSTRQYCRIVHSWVRELGADPSAYSTHSIRRTQASLIYRRTKNLRAVQLLLGHSKMESTVRYLGIEQMTRWKWLNRRKSEADPESDRDWSLSSGRRAK
jgi:site-specific recombinase XerD